jgi:hypothetical protein
MLFTKKFSEMKSLCSYYEKLLRKSFIYKKTFLIKKRYERKHLQVFHIGIFQGVFFPIYMK